MGVFLAFQYPSAIPGVTVASFLRNIYNAVHHPKPADADGEKSIKYTGIPLAKFRKLMEEKMALLHMDPAFAAATSTRVSPAARRSGSRCSRWRSWSPSSRSSTRPTPGSTSTRCRTSPRGSTRPLDPEMGVLMITHYQRMLNYVQPQFVHVLLDGRIVMSGGEELATSSRRTATTGCASSSACPSAPTDEASAPEPVATH